MILDGQNMFSEAQAITAAAVSTNAIDTSVARDIGTGEGLYVMVQCDVAMTDSGSDSTLAIALVTDSDPALGSAAVIDTLVTLPALTAAGTTLYFKIDPEKLVAFERYIGLSFTPAGGNLTTGSFTAGLVRNIQKSQNYPASGFSVV